MTLAPPRTTAVPLAAPRRRADRAAVEIGVGVGVLAVFVALAFLAPLITGYGVDEFVGAAYQPPSAEHWFGTDALGRDTFVRTFAAVRVDYLVAAIGALLSMVIGTALGLLTGAARRGIWGTAMMRVTDALIAIPFPLFILVIVMTVGSQTSVLGAPPGVVQILIALFVGGWAIYARMARAETLGLRSREYIVAAELMGYGRARILFRHMLPRVLGVTATYAVADAVMIIGFVAALPFLGAGVPPPTPEWGSMMYESRAALVTAWWLILFPGLALTVSAVAASLIGDALVDRSDRRLRRDR